MIRPLKNVLNQAGMGLAETLVATAMAAVVSVGILGFIQHSYKAQRSLRSSQAFNDYVSLSQLALDDVRACTYNFGTVDTTVDGFTLPDVGQEMDVELLHYDSTKPSQARSLAQKIDKDMLGKDSDFTLEKKVKLKTIAKTAPGHFIARIIIFASKTGEVLGNKETTQSFPIYVITDDKNKIASCYGNFASGGLADLQQKQCEVLMGGDFFWNPKTNRCENRYETKCFPGGRDSATCDAKTTFGLASDICTATGFSDPVTPTLPTRNYRSGAVRAGSAPASYSCTSTDQYSAQCDYADGVDASMATCSACCKVERQQVQEASPNAG